MVVQAEVRVGLERLTALEKLASDYGRMAQENRNRRISARLSYLMVGVAVAVTIFFFIQSQNRIKEQTVANKAAVAQIEAEGADRRNQNCEILERQHAETVRSLKLTYDYLAGLTPAQRQEPLNKLLITQLPQTEKQARIDQAPAYCDEPGAAAEAKGADPVGLPEPDPVIPKRPEVLNKILHATPVPTPFDMRNPDNRVQP